jgi:hypothetical protein
MPASQPRLRWPIDKQTVKIGVDGDWVWLVIDPPIPPLALDHDGAIGLAEALVEAASGLDRSSVVSFTSVVPTWWCEEPLRVCVGIDVTDRSRDRVVIKWLGGRRLAWPNVNQVDRLVHDLRVHAAYLKTGKLATGHRKRVDAGDGTFQIVDIEPHQAVDAAHRARVDGGHARWRRTGRPKWEARADPIIHREWGKALKARPSDMTREPKRILRVILAEVPEEEREQLGFPSDAQILKRIRLLKPGGLK